MLTETAKPFDLQVSITVCAIVIAMLAGMAFWLRSWALAGMPSAQTSGTAER